MMYKPYSRLTVTGKMTIFAVVFLLVSALGHAQSGGDSSVHKTEGAMSDLPVKPFRMPSLMDVGGSPFYNAEYKSGSVELGQGRVVNNVPLRFNTFNNAMMVNRDGEDLKLEFFESATIIETTPDGSQKRSVFKAGYPEVDGHGDNSIYQVLATGPKIQLLKYVNQKVEDVPTLGDYSRREIVTTEEIYVYVPGGQMKKLKSLKAGRQALVEALPAMAPQIDAIVAAKKLRLKSESDYSILIDELNKP